MTDRLKVVAVQKAHGIWDLDVWMNHRRDDNVVEIQELWEGMVGPFDDDDPTMVALQALQVVVNDLSQDPLF